MRVLLVDPTKQTVSAKDIDPTPAELRRLVGAKFVHAASLPNGDSVKAIAEAAGPEAFSIGGGAPIAGKAIVLRRSKGEYYPVKSDPDTILQLIRWSIQADPDASAEPDMPVAISATAKAIIVDPTSGTIEGVTATASKAGLDEAVGGATVVAMKVTNNDAVLVMQGRPSRTWRWRKDGLVFPGRSVIVGWDKDGNILNVTATLEDLKSSVEFKAPGRGPWVSYRERQNDAGPG